METPVAPWFIAIGASGGDGLKDIMHLLGAFPETMPAVVMIVLHRRWHYPTNLKTILGRVSRLPVIIADQGEQFHPGAVYIGEPSEHLTLAARSFGYLISDPERDHGNRTVDLLFRSVAKHAGTRMIGVVLSGSLDDGSRGLAAIHKAGGLTMVLKPGSPLRRGMPENAISFDGPISLVGTPMEIAAGISAALQADQPRLPNPQLA